MIIVLLSALALAISGPKLARAQQPKTPTIYLITIFDMWSSWTDPMALADYVEKAIRSSPLPLATTVRIVRILTFESFDELLKNPPEDAIIINCHGEAFPLTESFKNDWRAELKVIARNIREHGWVWIAIPGYAFYYYVTPDGKHTGIGGSGIDCMLSLLGYQGSVEMRTLNSRATDYGRALNRYLNYTLPNTIPAARPLKLSLPATKVYYECKDGYVAVAVIQVGRGAFVYCGVDQNDERNGYLAAAIALDILAAPRIRFAKISYNPISMALKIKLTASLAAGATPFSGKLTVRVFSLDHKTMFERTEDLDLMPGEVKEFEFSVRLPVLWRYVVEAEASPFLGLSKAMASGWTKPLVWIIVLLLILGYVTRRIIAWLRAPIPAEEAGET